MAESVDNVGTSLQYRLLKKRMDKLDPVRKARNQRIARLMGLGTAADVEAARAAPDIDLAQRLPVVS